MSASMLVLSLVVSASMQLTATQPAVPTPTAAPERYSLDNGLRVILDEDHRIPVVTTYMMYAFGSAHEREHEIGAAALLEQLMLGPAGEVPQSAHAWYVHGTGGGFGSSAEPDHTSYHHTVPSNFLEGVLWLEANRLSALDIDSAGLARARTAVVQQVRHRQTEPYTTAVVQTWLRAAYSNSAYAHAIDDTITTLDRLSLLDVRNLLATHYVPQNATLVICGDFDRQRTKDLVQKYFGPIPGGERHPAALPREAIQTTAISLTVEDPRARVPLTLMSWDVPPPYTADRDALELLAVALTDGPKAALQRHLVQGERLAARVLALTHLPARTYGPGQLVVLVIGRPDAGLDRVHAAIWVELERVARDGIALSTLTQAQTKLRQRSFESRTRTLEKAEQLAVHEAFLGGADRLSEAAGRYDDITVADVRRVAATYLTKPRSVTVDIVPRLSATTPPSARIR